MADVPTLSTLSCLVTVQALLDIREDTTPDSARRLIHLLQTESYTGNAR